MMPKSWTEICGVNCSSVCVAVGVCVAIKWIIGQVTGRREKRHFASQRARKRRECKQALADLRASLPTSKDALEKQKAILKLSVTDLLRELREEKILPIEVLEAYQLAALDAHEKTNCLIEPIKEAALWAQQLESQPKGLLYGLPFALKDDNSVKGYDSTLGLSRYIGQPCKQDSVMVKALKSAGAIPFVKTNVSQGMGGLESSNCIFGVTVNPHDVTRGAGGSSGGAGALVASGGAPMGSGSDLGGSLRCPAAFNGLFGFKPSPLRVSYKGCTNPDEYPPLLKMSYGPLSRAVDDIVVYMRALWSSTMFEDDSKVIPMSFQDEDFTSDKPLRIGYFVDNGLFRPAPAVERAVRLAKDALERAGHTVVAFEPKLTAELVRCIFVNAGGDGGDSSLKILKNETIDWDALGPVDTVLKMPRFLKKFFSFVFKPFSPELSQNFTNVCGCGSVSEWWEEVAQKERLIAEFFDNWKNQNLDGLLCPAFGVHALPLGSGMALYGGASYAMLFNTLECPAGVVPVTTVSEEDQEKAKSYQEIDIVHRPAKKGMENSVGLPIGVQCATLPYRDELCLRLMTEIDINL